MAMRDGFSEEDWTAWLEGLVDPAPLENWNRAFTSEAGVVQLHNTKAFLNVLFVNAFARSNENVKQLLPGLMNGLRQLP